MKTNKKNEVMVSSHMSLCDKETTYCCWLWSIFIDVIHILEVHWLMNVWMIQSLSYPHFQQVHRPRRDGEAAITEHNSSRIILRHTRGRQHKLSYVCWSWTQFKWSSSPSKSKNTIQITLHSFCANLWVILLQPFIVAFWFYYLKKDGIHRTMIWRGRVLGNKVHYLRTLKRQMILIKAFPGKLNLKNSQSHQHHTPSRFRVPGTRL